MTPEEYQAKRTELENTPGWTARPLPSGQWTLYASHSNFQVTVAGTSREHSLLCALRVAKACNAFSPAEA